jgi:predicted metal-dependent peptidase
MTSQEDILSACILRLRKKAPFFGALCLFMRHGLDETIETACTDGVSVFFSPAFVDSLTAEEIDAVMVHELLHAALLHMGRRGARDPYLWNVAADIVVNGIIRKQPGLTLPLNPCIDEKLEDYEVEEVYEILQSRDSRPSILWIGQDIMAQPGIPLEAGETQAHWKQALQEAATITRALGHGTTPNGMQRHIDGITDPQLDWRSILWRFLVRTPVDFSGFDRRFIGQGLYLESLDGESVSVRIAIDTSGSISSEELASFITELREILRLYPQLDCELYYADAALHGPFTPEDEGFETPVGGGGTSFVPFFEHLQKTLSFGETAVLVYLTDGYGTYPTRIPDQPVLWVVTPGGLRSDAFPFGMVARLI